MTPIAAALFEACVEQRLAHVSGSCDAAAALQTANALLQQVAFLATFSFFNASIKVDRMDAFYFSGIKSGRDGCISIQGKTLFSCQSPYHLQLMPQDTLTLHAQIPCCSTYLYLHASQFGTNAG